MAGRGYCRPTRPASGTIDAHDPRTPREGCIHVVIEIPRGSRNKYEIDHETRPRSSSTAGCSPPPPIPPTTASSPTPWAGTATRSTPWCCWRTRPSRACWVEARPSGCCGCRTRPATDAKIICVPPNEPRWKGVEDLRDLPEELLEEIKHFFDVYKALEPGKASSTAGFEGRKARLAGDRAQPGPPPRVRVTPTVRVRTARSTPGAARRRRRRRAARGGRSPAGVGPERGRVEQLAQPVADGLHDQVPQLHQAAAEDEQLGVEQVREVDEADADPAPEAVEDGQRGLVAGAGRGGDVLPRDRPGSPPASATAAGSRPSSAATRPKWARAEPEAKRSQHPRRPHGQSGPSGSTTMWPISPTKPLLPRWMTPPASTPPPMPVPSVTSTASRAPWALPTVDSASSAQVASLSMDASWPSRSASRSRSGRSRHLGDVRGGAEHALAGDQAGHADAERVGRPERAVELAEAGDQLVGLLGRRPPLLGEDRAVVVEQHAQALRAAHVDPDAPRHDTSMCSTSPERGGASPARSGHGPAQPVEQRAEAADHLGQAIGRGRVVERPFDGVQELAADVDRGPHDGLHRLDRLVGRRRRGLAGRRRSGHGRIRGRLGLTCHPVDASDRRRSR